MGGAAAVTELDILMHAKGYLDKLSAGIDPLTDETVPDDDVVRKERISKCLCYVSGVLEQVIARGGLNSPASERKKRLPAFSISDRALANVPVSETPITVTEFARRINDQVDPQAMEPLKAASILEYLTELGYLELIRQATGRSARRPTEQGNQLGITTVERQALEGSYTAVVYSPEAQQYLLTHMDQIISINTEKYNQKVDTGALQGTPWTPAQETQLRELYLRGTPIAEIARVLQRNTNGIQARVKLLGLQNHIDEMQLK